MGVQGRLTSSLSVGGLTVAGGLAIFLSTSATAGMVRFPVPPTGDPEAATALGRAVDTDLEARSFVAHVTSYLRRPGYSGTQSYTVVYQAPDRSELIGPGPGSAVITAGAVRFSRAAFTTAVPLWVRFTVERGQLRGGSMATIDLLTLKGRTAVRARGSSYRVVTVTQVVPGSTRVEQLGVGEVQTVLTAEVRDHRVVGETLRIEGQAELISLVLHYQDFDNAPAIEIPTHVLQVPQFCPGKPLPSTQPCS